MNSINIVTKTPTTPAIIEDIDITNTVSSETPNFSGSSENTSSIFSKLTFTNILIIILILAFLGFNVFQYLANVTDKTTSFLDSITKTLRKIFNFFIGEPVKDVVIASGEGTKVGINETAKALNTGIDAIEQVIEPEQHEKEHNSALNKLSKMSKNRKKKQRIQHDVSDSQIQTSDNKGYCYVGTDRDFRTCVKVNSSDQCLSGDIFPSRDLCINPSLRE